jgi:hypothetical protein
MLSTFGRRSLAIMGFAVIGLAIFEYSPARYVERPDLDRASASFVKRTRDGLQVLVTPSTLSVERRQGVRLRATHDFDQRCGRIDATIPELNWQQSLTRKELFEGLEIQLNPVRTGQFSIAFTCDGREIGSAGISVVLPQPQLSQKPIVRPTRFVLWAGSPIYNERSFFVLPVMVRVEEQRGAIWVPVVVGRDTDFRLLDSNGQVGQGLQLTIIKNTAMSAPVYLAFGIESDYDLTAFRASDGKTSNALRISWKMVGPPLSLKANPRRIELYAAAISTASVNLYLTDGNVELRPRESLSVLITNPPNIRSDPPDRLMLTPEGPIGTYKVSGRSRATAAQASFLEPKTNAQGVLEVTVRPTIFFTLCALAGGFLGGAISRKDDIIALATTSASRKQILVLIVGLAISVVAGWSLYFGSLNGVFTFLHITELNYGMALFIGIFGGVAGISVFTWVVKRWFS